MLAKYIGRGSGYARQNRLKSALLIGYGASLAEMDFDPWGEPCHVAILGHESAGGPRILGAARPILADAAIEPVTESEWIPISKCADDMYEFRGRHTTMVDLMMAIVTRRVVTSGATLLIPGSQEYFAWIGFLLSLED